MTATARERLAALLGEVASPGSFSTRRTAPVRDLRLEVRGVGQLALPVSKAQARQLCQVGRPARYGRGEHTLLDTRVRDTSEIPRSRVKIDQRQWNKTLLPVLDGIRADLGLAPGCQLKAELHSMLVYAPGQFFAPHQDSEKVDAMVGSLVVTLPTSAGGGGLVVEHAGRRATYRPSKTALSFVAFYADCLHEVRPTRSGYRVVLTYNLLLRGEARADAAVEAVPGVVEALARHLDEHFSTPAPSPYRQSSSPPADPPSRLAYLLDHEYTASGLHWARLKGEDVRRAELLRAAADRADCDVVLALADVHETWSCSEAEPAGGWGARGWSGRRWEHNDDAGDDAGDDVDDEWFDDPDDPDDPDLYELDELVDGTTTIEWWIAPSADRAERFSTSVADTEVCATTPSADLRPYASEHEGYMGNYGNTMDRWYRRAAVVLWPRRRAFVVRAEASTGWALDELARRVRAGDKAGAQEDAAALAPFWAHRVGAEPPRGFTAKALRLARALDEPALATMLLKPLRVEALAPGQARALVALVERYGEPWARDLLAGWSGRGRAWAVTGRGRAEWMPSLARLCQSLEDGGGTGTATARLLVEDSWTWLGDKIESACGVLPPSRRDQALAQLARPVAAVLASTAVVAATDVQEAMVGFLCRENDELLPLLIHVVRAATKLPPNEHPVAAFDTLALHCAARLEARLARPQRAGDDWSIDLPGGCSCELCAVLGDFLADGARRTFEWPIAQERRQHVHGRLDRGELPVRHQTRRTGRPYTLVLTKTEALFEREAQARRHDEADLAWLHERHGPAISPGARRGGRGGRGTADPHGTDAAGG